MLTSLFLLSTIAFSEPALAIPNPRVLVFSKTAEFRHDSIPDAIEMLKSFETKGMMVTATEDSAVFDKKLASKYDCIVFAQTTGDVLNDQQQKCLIDYIHAGRGFVGFHAASDTEHKWDWYKSLVGGEFLTHAPGTFDVRVVTEDFAHPTTNFMPKEWRHTDEWYDFVTNPRSRVRVLQSIRNEDYSGSKMVGDHPISWCQEFEGGRSWYTGLGHTKETYQEKYFRDAVYQGILWTSQAQTPKGVKKIKWTQPKSYLNSVGKMGSGLYHLELECDPKAPLPEIVVKSSFFAEYKTIELNTYAKSARKPGNIQTIDFTYEAPINQLTEFRFNGVSFLREHNGLVRSGARPNVTIVIKSVQTPTKVVKSWYKPS